MAFMGECLVVNDIDSQFYQYHRPAAEGKAAESDPEQTQWRAARFGADLRRLWR
jgi:hypothetical protein